MTKYLTVAEVHLMQHQSIERFGGRPGVLDAVIATP